VPARRRPDVYACLVRGINVGGKNRLAMADLRTLVESLGGEDVTTYVQSGNVVFRSAHPNAAAVAKELRTALERDAGLSVTVAVRTGAQLERIVAANPYAGREDDPTKLHVAFFLEPPRAGGLPDLEARAAPGESIVLAGGEAYLHLPAGMGRSELAAAVEKHLGTATVRNWRTVLALAELAASRAS
jgi:uncharacterized protein (DUF1697 family)